MEKWTQDEAIAFECARECITHMIAIQSGLIADEEKKDAPNAERIESFRAESSRLFQERSALHIHHHAEIARIRAEYGAFIRASMG